MIPNMIGFCKSVTELKDHAKNFPNAPRILSELSANDVKFISSDKQELDLSKYTQ